MCKINWSKEKDYCQKLVDGAGLKITIKLVDGDTIDFDGYVTVRQEERKIKGRSIFYPDDAFVIKPVFVVEVAEPVYNYPNEPDDVDIIEVDAIEHLHSAINKAVLICVQTSLDNVAEGIGMQEMYEEEQQFEGANIYL